MLTEERQKIILSLVEEKGSVTATELMEALNASESTIRRDLNSLSEAGLLQKVHGGAISNNSNSYNTLDDEVELRKERNKSEKNEVAKYAASLIEENDFVYLDAGTTTEAMIDYISCKNATFVTNAINHARKLTCKGYTTYLLGGEFKSVTEAIVGEEAIASVMKYNFTKGFFGTNGVTLKNGFTTPEVKEAMIKKRAIEAAKKSYILCDSSKFGEVSAITFLDFNSATIITDKVPASYKKFKNIIEA